MMKRVLVVDDDARIQSLVRAACSSYEDLEIVSAESMQAALEAFHSEHPQLIFMDITLPGGSGLAALRQIKAACAKEKIKVPIYMISARSSQQDKDKAIAYGADGYIAKPFTLEHIENVLDSTFEK